MAISALTSATTAYGHNQAEAESNCNCQQPSCNCHCSSRSKCNHAPVIYCRAPQFKACHRIECQLMPARGQASAHGGRRPANYDCQWSATTFWFTFAARPPALHENSVGVAIDSAADRKGWQTFDRVPHRSTQHYKKQNPKTAPRKNADRAYNWGETQMAFRNGNSTYPSASSSSSSSSISISISIHSRTEISFVVLVGLIFDPAAELTTI